MSLLLVEVAGAQLTPTDEEAQAFTIKYDGASRPELITSWTKLQVVLGNEAVLDVLRGRLTSADFAALVDGRARVAKTADSSGALLADLLKGLCEDIHNLNGEEVARRVVEMDVALEALRDATVQEILNGLSVSGAQAVMDEGLKAAGRVKGTWTDVAAFGKQFPEYVKKQYLERCVSFGLTEPADSD